MTATPLSSSPNGTQSSDMNSNVNSDDVILAAVEGGGTTFVLAIARILPSSSSSSSESSSVIPHANIELLKTTQISSSDITPSETLRRCSEFFHSHRPSQAYAALGVATFGPVGLNPHRNEQYGRILPSTPKKEWRDVDFLSPLLDACSSSSSSTEDKIPHRIDTDVNAPALAEFLRYNDSNKNKQITSTAYITVGTGVGVGLVINSKPVHGRMHPEGGHVVIQPLKVEATAGAGGFEGYSWGVERSPYGGKNTVEGVASSVALAERLFRMSAENESDGKNGGGGIDTDIADSIKRNELKNLPDTHPIWDHAANALANLCVTLILITSVERIVLGGGIMRRTVLYDAIRKRTVDLINGYLDLPSDMEEFITDSTWGEQTGLVGAIMLAKEAYEESKGGNEECERGKPDEYYVKDSADEKKKMKRTFADGFVHGAFFVGVVLACTVALRAKRGGK